MERGDREIERALQTALGKPKYFIDTEGKKPGERYFWFPTQGDSMTDKTKNSIPGGSLVLARWLQITSVQQIPLQQPIVIIIDDGGRQYCMLKSASRIIASAVPPSEGDYEKLCLHSYNPRYEDFWLPFNCVKFVFVVERVRLPNGKEFKPELNNVQI